jgi:hypothetical protein
MIAKILSTFAVAWLLGVPAATTVHAADTPREPKAPYKVEGFYLEGCACDLPCPCELTGLKHGCQGVGGVRLRGDSSYDGVSLAGCKIAYAGMPGKWVRLYIDAKSDAQAAAARGLAKAAFKSWGDIESVRDVKIEMGHKDGKYHLKVDGGTVIDLSSEPVLGGDGKNPLSYSNTRNLFSRTFRQARTLNCTFKDGNREFKLKDSNSYFNESMRNEGKL